MIEILVFGLLAAAVIGIVGFIGIGDSTAAVGRVVFFTAIVLFLISAVVGVARGRTRA